MNTSIKDFLNNLDSFMIKRKESSNLTVPNKDEVDNIKKKLTEISNNNEITLICRGEKKKRLKDKFQNKLNSNDSLFDGIFLVGDKAKNFLTKTSEIPHPIKEVNTLNKDVFNWIFDFFSKQTNTSIVDLEYFKDENNRTKFTNSLRENKKLVNCYLYGIHTINSDTLVNFVSGTSEINITKNYNNNLIIIYWENKKTQHLSINKKKLENYKKIFEENNLPPITDSNYPNEFEIAIKGCIFPHFIIGVYDINEKYFIPNPHLTDNNENWIINGFNINQEQFSTFIKSSKYKRFLLLIEDTVLEEKTVDNIVLTK